MLTFQAMIRTLHDYWASQGCLIQEGYDVEKGAGTFNPITLLRCLGPEPYRSAYVEPCRRPTDGRYGENPNRFQHYFQYQVLFKPSPIDLQERYIGSLEAIGFDLSKHDIRFVHDDWESPTLGAWGLGWEVWIDGMEVTQFTYFQAAGGQTLKPVTGELTYGLERIAMYLQGVDRFQDIQWNEALTYGDVYHRNEVEWSHYNFTESDSEMWFRHFDDYEREAKRLIAKKLPIPGYDFVVKASHAFNMLDARGVISVTERTGYIGRIRELARLIAEEWLASRAELKYPLLKAFSSENGSAASGAEEVYIAPGHSFDPKKKADFLLEIGCEELPATFVPIGCQNLQVALEKMLADQGLSHGAVEVSGTPRRLFAYIKGLAEGKSSSSEEKRGPAVAAAFDKEGQLSRAGEGFLRSIGLTGGKRSDVEAGKVSGVLIRDGYLYGTQESPGRATVEILSEKLPGMILGLDFPKKMTWSDLDIAWARPIRWLVAMHGDHEIPFVIGNVTAGSTSMGHRQLAPREIQLRSASEYFDAMKAAKVMVRASERQQVIEKQLVEIEKNHSCSAVARDRVMPQVVNLVEWPTCMVGEFKESFLQVPKEVLISEMVEHQKYFPLQGRNGDLLPLFVITSNNRPTEEIQVGNQRVLSARLSDGSYHYKHDLKASFEEWNEKLKTVTFQRQLGSVYDKVTRVVANVKVIHELLKKHNHHAVGNLDHALRAAQVCKADLASQLVYEFPELQGMVGRHYGKMWGEDQAVALAIDEHWMPRGEGAPLPQSIEGMLVSLADKVDNLLGCFVTGQKPKSSSDPYALRRQVLGIVHMLINQKLYLPLLEVFELCSHNFPDSLVGNRQEIIGEIAEFISNRIRTVFQGYGFSQDETVASLRPGFRDIYATYRKVEALHSFRRENEAFPQLMEVYKRARGQLEGAKPQALNATLVKEDAEQQLYESLQRLAPDFDAAVQGHDYAEAYALVSKLQPKIVRLFDEVRILADDPAIRNNRLALLQQVFGLFDRLLDLSALQNDVSQRPVTT